MCPEPGKERQFRRGGETPSQEPEWRTWALGFINEYKSLVEDTAVVTKKTQLGQVVSEQEKIDLYNRFADLRDEFSELKAQAAVQDIVNDDASGTVKVEKVGRGIDLEGLQRTFDGILLRRVERIVESVPQEKKEQKETTSTSLLEHPYLKSLQLFIDECKKQLVATNGAPNTFDPTKSDKAGLIPLIRMAELKNALKVILPEKGPDPYKNDEINKANLVLNDAEAVVKELLNRTETLTKNKYAQWESAEKTKRDGLYARALAAVAKSATKLGAVGLNTELQVVDKIILEISTALEAEKTDLDQGTKQLLLQHFLEAQVDPYLNSRRNFWNTLKISLVSSREKLQSLINSHSNMQELNQLLGVALKSGIGLSDKTDAIEDAFEIVRKRLETFSQNIPIEAKPQFIEFEKRMLLGEFERRKAAYFADMASVEAREVQPGDASNQFNFVQKQKIFDKMETIIVSLRSKGLEAKEIGVLERQIALLKKDQGLRSNQYFFTTKARHEVIFPDTHSSRAVAEGYTINNHPLNGSHATSILNEATELEGNTGANAKLGIVQARVPNQLLDVILKSIGTEQVTIKPIPGNTKESQVEYRETAVGWVMMVLDEIYERRYVDASGKLADKTTKALYIKVNGEVFPVPRTLSSSGGGKIMTGSNLHLVFDQLVDYIAELEEKRTAGKPRFDKVLVNRAAILHAELTWNHQYLNRSSMEGISDSTYYGMNWPEYSRNEFGEGVANYSMIPTVFLFGYQGFSPWKLLGEKAPAMVEEELKSRGLLHEFEYILSSFMPLLDTSSPGTKPNHPMFTPPLRSVQAGKNKAGEHVRFPKASGRGMIMTLDDVRGSVGGNDGVRLYQLMQLDQIGPLAHVYNGYAKNAIGFMNTVLKKDPSGWDAAFALNEYKKGAKYASSLFGPYGLAISLAQESGSKEEYQKFLEKISVFVTMVKGITMLLPTGVKGGGGKQLHDLGAFLTQEASRNTINHHAAEMIRHVLEKLFRRKVFSAKLGTELANQFEKFTLLGADVRH